MSSVRAHIVANPSMRFSPLAWALSLGGDCRRAAVSATGLVLSKIAALVTRTGLFAGRQGSFEAFQVVAVADWAFLGVADFASLRIFGFACNLLCFLLFLGPLLLLGALLFCRLLLLGLLLFTRFLLSRLLLRLCCFLLLAALCFLAALLVRALLASALFGCHLLRLLLGCLLSFLLRHSFVSALLRSLLAIPLLGDLLFLCPLFFCPM